MKIVLADKINISEDYKARNNQELKSRIKDAEVITANYVDITPEIIDSAPNLKYIIVPAVGYEWVDVNYASEKGITTLNCPTYNSQAVAEHAISLMLAVNRNLLVGADELRTHRWNPQTLVGYELEGKKLGLIGHGNIGSRIEKIATALGLAVDFINSKSTAGEVDDLLRSSDFIIICAPLTDKTRGLIDEHRLGLLKPTAVLVNVGRGAILDQNALKNALETKKIRGAGLDVFDGEPLAGTPNDAIVRLASLSNVVATPHIAYNTEEIKDKQGAEILANLNSCIVGNPINVVKKP